MGITLEATSPLLAAVEGMWVETAVKTLPGLGTNIAWAELRNLPIRANEVTVRHETGRKSVLINQWGPALIWQATFPGSFDILLVNGRPMKARTRKGALRPPDLLGQSHSRRRRNRQRRNPEMTGSISVLYVQSPSV